MPDPESLSEDIPPYTVTARKDGYIVVRGTTKLHEDRGLSAAVETQLQRGVQWLKNAGLPAP